jgi:tRNA-dihydrouridine synthase 3
MEPAPVSNPLEPQTPLKRPLPGEQLEGAHPPQPIFTEDSAVTKAEKVERSGQNDSEEPSAKRIKLEQPGQSSKEDTSATGNGGVLKTDSRDKVRGIAMIKAE